MYFCRMPTEGGADSLLSPNIQSVRGWVITMHLADDGTYNVMNTDGDHVGDVLIRDFKAYWSSKGRYTLMRADGSIDPDCVPTDLAPGDSPSYVVDGHGFKALETARLHIHSEFLKVIRSKDDGEISGIYDGDGKWVEDHYMSGTNMVHYITFEEWTHDNEC